MNSVQDTGQKTLPPEEVSLVAFQASPYPDRRRILCRVIFSPFQEKPSAEIKILDQENRELTTVNIIQVRDPESILTIHLPGQVPGGEYTALLQAFYLQEKEIQEEGTIKTVLEEQAIGTLQAKFSISP